MSAQAINAWTVAFAAGDLSPDQNQFGYGSNSSLTRVPYAYNYITSLDIRTLTNPSLGNSPGSVLAGLLYVPDLLPNDPCTNLSQQYVPANVTRVADFPSNDYPTVALAPWINSECTKSYLYAAGQVDTQAFLFYLAGNDNGSTPPDPTNEVWNLQDGGNWQKDTQFPVYAIPGLSGQLLMQASSAYNGNITQVPNGQQLAETYGIGEYVRLFMEINTAGGGSTLPSIWLFLLVVLGILLTVMGFTSFLMHYLQRRRRALLRRRVANGEIDLETLGIKRLTVPQRLLNQMPLYIYGTGAPVAKADTKGPTISSLSRDTMLSSANSSRPSSPSADVRPTQALNRSSSYHPTPLQQPTCAICLDDFIAASSDTKEGDETSPSTIRELPCHHIFHPECVDAFLLNNSSLCPMCKKSALPMGYCPQVITNAMVRRERMIRRAQERRGTTPSTDPAELQRRRHEDLYVDVPAMQFQRAFSGAGLRWLGGRARGDGRRISSAPVGNSQPMVDLPPSSVRAPPSALLEGPDEPTASPAPPVASASRREWARERAVAMLGRGAAAPPPVADPDEVEAHAPLWRRTWRALFPALAR